MKSKNIDGVNVLYSANWINDLEKELHFNWYYQQAKLVYENCTREDTILELGIGTGLLSDLLKKRNWKVTTLDIDEDKHPDICENALDFEYAEKGFNVLIAFEIFEHIPYATFQKLVEKLSASNIQKLYFSVPWNERQLMYFKLCMPFIQEKSFRIVKSRNEITTAAHFWELSKVSKNVGKKELVNLKKMFNTFESNRYMVNQLEKIGSIQYFEAKLQS